MSWTGTYTFTAFQVLTAAQLNAVQDNINYLHTSIASQILLSGGGIIPSTTNGCASATKVEMATNKQNFMWPSFADGTKLYGEWTMVVLPADYDGGTVTAKFIWTANSASTNPVVWGLQGRAYADGDTIDQAWGTAVEVADANQSAFYKTSISAASAAITLAGTPAAGKMAQFRAYRDPTLAGDTLAAAALLVGVSLTYTRL